jgi:hypothetical protein
VKEKDFALSGGQDQYKGRQETVEFMRDEEFMRKIRRGMQSLRRAKKR